jgi:histidyl-tRNA synthetase
VSIKDADTNKASGSANMTNIQAPRGTYDILPDDSPKWQQVEAQLRTVIQRAGYREIRVPIFEHTDLFKRGVGETTDIVNKEMYTFTDRSDRSLTLRPEGTAGVVRAYLSNGMSRQPSPVKLWYSGPMFRYERTQTGRQRQFHQTGMEAFGSAGPAIDAEVIVLAVDCMHAVGIKDFAVHLNSIGCLNCRPAFREKLREFMRPHLPELCEDCHDRFERNPLRMLDCKNEKCRQFFVNVPSFLDNLCEDCKNHWDGLLKHLQELGLVPVINEKLVRGLDYYGRTVFELITDDPRLGAQATICAGGRYDYLVESLGGPPTPAIGWALGMERICLLIGDVDVAKPLAFVVSSNGHEALKLATELRRAGLACEMDYPPNGAKPRAFNKQLEKSNKSGAKWTLILGDDELATGQVSVKNMADGSQTKLPVKEIIPFLAANTGSGEH